MGGVVSERYPANYSEASHPSYVGGTETRFFGPAQEYPRKLMKKDTKKNNLANRLLSLFLLLLFVWGFLSLFVFCGADLCFWLCCFIMQRL
jgi:hypothetical protein